MLFMENLEAGLRKKGAVARWDPYRRVVTEQEI